MTKEMRRKRLELLYKIEDLKSKCNCQTAAISKECPNCQEIAKLGKQLLKHNNRRKKIQDEKSVEADAVTIVGDDTIPHVPRNENGGRSNLNWSGHHEIIVKYAKLHRIVDLAVILNVSYVELVNYYSRNGITDFKNGRKSAAIYNFMIGSNVVHTGTMSDLEKLTGKGGGTLRWWRKRPGKNGERVVKVSEGNGCYETHI